MKKTILLLIAGLGIISCNENPKKDIAVIEKIESVASADKEREGVFIHITESYNEPHRVLMPLKMAVMMANDKDVLVYMDIHAVELLV